MYNKAQIIGRLGQDPEVRYTKDQKAIANLSVATTETWKDRQSGERKEKTEWHRVVLFGKTAETARDYLKKGALVLFEGPIRTRKWQSQDGQDHYTTEIHADLMKIMYSNKASDSSSNSTSQNPPAPPYSDMGSYDDFDDIDF